MNDFFDECDQLVNDDRQNDYGDPTRNFERIAQTATNVLGMLISPKDVALFLMCIKLVREGQNHKRDNLLDLACYAEILDRIEEGR